MIGQGKLVPIPREHDRLLKVSGNKQPPSTGIKKFTYITLRDI